MINNRVINGECFKIFPNPSEKFINIYFKKNINNCIVSISNILGGRIYEERLGNLEVNNLFKINTTDLQYGFYFLEIYTNHFLNNRNISIFFYF